MPDSTWNNMQLRETWRQRYESGYFDPEGHLNLAFVCRAEIEPLVMELSKSVRIEGRSFPALTTHQLRRFFGHSRLVERELRVRKKDWGLMAPHVKKLDHAAQDAVGKHEAKVPISFHEFIQWNVNIIKSERDFIEGFMPHFEAVVGFSSGQLKDR